MQAAERATAEETGNDQEAESRVAHAAHIVGAWLKPLAGDLQSEMDAVDVALRMLGLHPWWADALPQADARFEALCAVINNSLRDDAGEWREDERLILFTEYKTSLDYIYRRLQARYLDDSRILTLTGGMDENQRGMVKRAFNDPANPVRILLGTDAAAEGLNLQETARYLLHFDVPFNPSRLEQRNGRLDRHGQARDVTVFHFSTQDDADLAFLAHVVNKVHTIREDLGSAGEVFEAAFQRRFVAGDEGDEVQRDLDATLEIVKGRAAVPRDASTSTAPVTGQDEGERLRALAAEIDLDPVSLRDTLEVALGLGYGQPRFEAPDNRGRVRLKHPLPPGWEPLIDDCLRLNSSKGQRGALPSLVFDPHYYIQEISGRPVFRPERDTTLLHLAHPLFHRALTSFARARFPGAGKHADATRWTVKRGGVPHGADALLLLTVEEIAANELRESFHHWVTTLQNPNSSGTNSASR